MAEVQEEEEPVAARNIVMTETETTTTAASESETGAPTTHAYCDPATLREVIRLDHCGAADVCQTQGGGWVHARATVRKRRYWDQPSGIQNKKKKLYCESDTERERLGC